MAFGKFALTQSSKRSTQSSMNKRCCPFDDNRNLVVVAVGELKIVRGTQAELREACPGSFNPGWNAIGCAKRSLGDAACTIYVLKDSALQSIGWDLEVVLRHERAHCNGWHHDRAR